MVINTFLILAYLWGVHAATDDFDDFKWYFRFPLALAYPLVYTATLIWLLLAALWTRFAPRCYWQTLFIRTAELRRVCGWQTRSNKEFGIFKIGEVGPHTDDMAPMVHFGFGKRGTIIGLMSIPERFVPTSDSQDKPLF